MAVQDGAKSIAFPTVGCGRLGYEPRRVVDSFVRSRRQSKSTLLVKTHRPFFFLSINQSINQSVSQYLFQKRQTSKQKLRDNDSVAVNAATEVRKGCCQH